jgi:hypothetical protein
LSSGVNDYEVLKRFYKRPFAWSPGSERALTLAFFARNFAARCQAASAAADFKPHADEPTIVSG